MFYNIITELTKPTKNTNSDDRIRLSESNNNLIRTQSI